MENETNNLLLLGGKVEASPVFSHESHGISFFSFSLLSKRLSGTFDRIPVIIREKLKCQYFGHLMRRVDSLEKTLMLGGIGGRRRRG